MFMPSFNSSISNPMEKLNMVIGTFYSEIGTELLSIIANMDVEIVKSQSKFKIVFSCPLLSG